MFGRATIGKLVTDLYSGPVNRWDRVNTLRVRLFAGGLASVTEPQLLSGTLNALAIENRASGKWEVLQFAQATLVEAGVYDLSTLLRGQLGTADAMGSPVPAGAFVAVLEPGLIVPLNVGESIASQSVRYRWGPAQYGPTDDGYLQGKHQGTKAGLRPYSPCDVWVHRASNNNLVLTWKRRTRLKGDDWGREEVPLIEESEKYRLQFLTDGGAGTVKRTVTVTSPTYTYTAAEQIEDFGTTRWHVRLRLAQYGADYGGYGAVLENTFAMRSAD